MEMKIINTKLINDFEYISSIFESEDFINKVNKPVKHIGIIISSLKHGGAERVVSLMADMFIDMGYQVTFMTFEKNTSDDYKNSNIIPRIILHENLKKREDDLVNQINKLQIDTIICNEHYSMDNLSSIIFAKKAKCNVVLIEHSSIFYPLYSDSGYLYKFKLLLYKSLDALICPNINNTMLWQALGIKSAIYISNPIIPAKKVNNTKRTIDILFVGRINNIKGCDKLLHVLKYVCDELPDVKVTIAGHIENKKYMNSLNKLANELNVSNNIIFAGHIKNIQEVYNKTSVYFLSSTVEGFSLSLMESKAAAVPCVAMGLAYLDSATQEEGCIVTGKYEYREAADSIIKLLREPDFWEDMSNKAYISSKKFNSEIIKQKWFNLFEAIPNNNVEDSFKIDDNMYNKNFVEIMMNGFYEGVSHRTGLFRKILNKFNYIHGFKKLIKKVMI